MRREHGKSLSLMGFDEGSVFRSIFGAHPDAMLLVDGNGDIVMSNPAAEALLGYSADELAAMSVDALLPSASRGRHASHRETYGRAPRARPMGDQTDLAAQRKDGSEVRVEIALSPLQDHGLPFVVASIRDIGEYPRVKKALKQARYSEHLAQLARLAVDERNPDALLAHAPRIAAEALQLRSAIVHLLEDGGRQFRVAAGVGLLPDLPVGARMPASPDCPPGVMLAAGHTVVMPDYAGAVPRLHPRLVDAGLVCGAASPLSDRGRIFGALTIHSDRPYPFGPDEIRFLESVCGLLATSLQRARTEEALNHSQRLESVGQLTGGIAHDFNNLLTVIQGNLQILETLPNLAADARGQKLLDAAGRATRRAAELTSKLLAFSRRQVLQPNAVDVSAMLHSLADMLRRTLDQRVRIAIDVEPGCPGVLADPVQLESALLNIAINARDAMPDGGDLVFRARRATTLPDDAAIAAAPGDAPGFVSIAVSDTGTGMPEAVRERAFEPFFTTKGAGRGTGLGLSTVYGFATQSGGTVTLDSAPGAGTTVTMHLPQPGVLAAVAPDEPASPQAVPRGLRVLLVEDDSAVRAVALEFLEALAARVTACVNGEEALAAIDAGAQFDLLLSDIALGAGMRGTELARKAQARRPGLAVLLVSGFSAELIDVDRVAPPDWALLPKPYSRNDLTSAIATALGGAPE